MKTILAGLLFSCTAFSATDVSGKWSGYPLYVILKQNGAKLTGSAGMSSSDQMPLEKAAVTDDRITFHVGNIEADLRVKGDEISGEVHQGTQNLRVLLHRVKERDAGAPALRFDAVSVRSVAPGFLWTSTNSKTKADPGRLTWSNVTLMRFITTAFDVKEYQVVAPDWVNDARYDMTATMPAHTSTDDAQLMLQTLLADRFKLAMRHEKRDLSVYALVIGKGGLKLQPAGNPGHSNVSGGPKVRTLTAETTFDKLAGTLSSYTDRPVVDMTGTPGAFRIKLEWAQDESAAPSSGDSMPGQSIFTAIAGLGLKLEPRKAPVKMIVVERINRSPGEN